MSNKKNVLIFTFPHLGHITPILSFLSQIDAETNNIFLFTTEKYVPYFNELKCNFFLYETDVEKYAVQNSEVDMYQTLEDINNMYDVFAEYYGVYEKIIARYGAELEEISTDVVYADSFAIWGNIYAVKEKCCFYILECFYYQNEEIRRKSLESYYITYRKKDMTEIRAVLDSSECKMQAVNRRIERRLGITQNEQSRLYCPEKTFVMLDKSLQPYAELCEDNVVFVGNAVIQSHKSGETDKKNKVFVTFGREKGKKHIEKVQYIVDFFTDYPQYEVVITTLEAQNIRVYGKEHIKVSNFVNQNEVLSSACLMITHGGVTGVKEALRYGVPMLFIPETVQQYVIANRIETMGKGKVIDIKDLSI